MILRNLGRSFYYALSGIVQAFLRERNMKIHAIMITIVVIIGCSFHITSGEWLAIILTIGLVVGLEMINTAVEALVDLVTEEYKYLAAVAKNVAAGAVLIAAIVAVIVAIVVFLPYVKAF
jgi:undecaprenol kinase